MIGRKAEAVLNRAVRSAVEQEHEYFTLEHVLWSLLADAKISETILACGGDPQEIRRELELYLQAEIPKASRAEHPPESSRGGEAARENAPDKNSDPTRDNSSDHRMGGSEEMDEYPVEHPVATLSIQRLIQRALFHVQSAGKDEIQPEDLLVALFQAKDSKALYMLARQGIERLDVLNYISHGIRKDKDSEKDEEMEDSEDSPDGSDGEADDGPVSKPQVTKSQDDPLSLYALNLNERAKAGRIDPLIGRQIELDRIIQTLCRRRKNNPLLVGEAGVGKTALAEGLAMRIVARTVPDLLHHSIVYSLDLGALLAGAKFRGDFEQRFKKVIQSLETKKERGFSPILFIDEIHTIIGAGAVSGGALDAANLLKPFLSQGAIRCIGSTTYAEYRGVFEKDHALARRFQKIDVAEPTIDEAVQILMGLKPRFEEHHRVIYSAEAIRAAVELSAKHLTERFLPDKAIDIIDEAGAKVRLKRNQASGSLENEFREGGQAKEEKGFQADFSGLTEDLGESQEPEFLIDSPLIEEVVAQIARIPARSISTSQKVRLKNLKSDLKLSIFGQDPGVEALVTAIRLARSGLRTGDRPVGCFLFCGPTGVGKTELSKQLSHCLGVPFLRFDMSEYSEKHTVSRLIGAPPGYVGFEQAGLLTDGVLKNPHSVILLDELEKAHPDIWNVLLQVMDHGMLTDSNGRKADFRNAILIMTSNVGSRELERRPLGMGSAGAGSSGLAAQKAVEQTFSPEFRNRLDAIVYFNPLDPATVVQVVNKHLMELESQLLSKKVDVEFAAEVKDWLAEKGYDRLMGARPLNRLIQDRIKKPLSEEILFGRLEHGGKVRVFVQNDDLAFEYHSAPVQRAGQESEARVQEVRDQDPLLLSVKRRRS
ncbi:MAG: AAA family ATPase [Bdellovibrionia bacterium]